MSVKSKIPDVNSYILTTIEELHKLSNKYKNLKILPYDENDNFTHYILKALAAYRINLKELNYDLTFSIDPGSKKIGMVVLLDDYYLISHTFLNTDTFIDSIRSYINCFQKDGQDLSKLTFKFGSGVIPLTLNLIKIIFETFQKRKNFKIFLINESKSSNVKFQYRKKMFSSKHELSALILALRTGYEIDQLNFDEVFEQGNIIGLNNRKGNEGIFNETRISKQELRELFQKILSNEISLSQSSKLLNR
ncbi:MAG: hypothetical protein ACFE8N_12650 [Promethearchaeota archaeon]